MKKDDTEDPPDKQGVGLRALQYAAKIKPRERGERYLLSKTMPIPNSARATIQCYSEGDEGGEGLGNIHHNLVQE